MRRLSRLTAGDLSSSSKPVKGPRRPQRGNRAIYFFTHRNGMIAATIPPDATCVGHDAELSSPVVVSRPSDSAPRSPSRPYSDELVNLSFEMFHTLLEISSGVLDPDEPLRSAGRSAVRVQDTRGSSVQDRGVEP